MKILSSPEFQPKAWSLKVTCQAPESAPNLPACGTIVQIDIDDIYLDSLVPNQINWCWQCPTCRQSVAILIKELPKFKFPNKKEWLQKRQIKYVKEILSLYESIERSSVLTDLEIEYNLSDHVMDRISGE